MAKDDFEAFLQAEATSLGNDWRVNRDMFGEVETVGGERVERDMFDVISHIGGMEVRRDMFGEVIGIGSDSVEKAFGRYHRYGRHVDRTSGLSNRSGSSHSTARRDREPRYWRTMLDRIATPLLSIGFFWPFAAVPGALLTAGAASIRGAGLPDDTSMLDLFRPNAVLLGLLALVAIGVEVNYLRRRQWRWFLPKPNSIFYLGNLWGMDNAIWVTVMIALPILVLLGLVPETSSTVWMSGSLAGCGLICGHAYVASASSRTFSRAGVLVTALTATVFVGFAFHFAFPL